MAKLSDDGTYGPQDDMYPGSYFTIRGLTPPMGRSLARSVSSALPMGWETEWDGFTDSLEVFPVDKDKRDFTDAEYMDWDRSGNHGKLVNVVTSWLGKNFPQYKLASGGNNMTPKLSSQNADRVLARLDRVAATIQEKYASWGMSFEDAKRIVNAIDETADTIELSSFGRESLARRQAEVMGGKTARVVQRDADEKYMDTFKNPMMPVQIESDEPYMHIYDDDQSSAVGTGESTSGRKLAPHY